MVVWTRIFLLCFDFFLSRHYTQEHSNANWNFTCFLSHTVLTSGLIVIGQVIAVVGGGCSRQKGIRHVIRRELFCSYIQLVSYIKLYQCWPELSPQRCIQPSISAVQTAHHVSRALWAKLEWTQSWPFKITNTPRWDIIRRSNADVTLFWTVCTLSDFISRLLPAHIAELKTLKMFRPLVVTGDRTHPQNICENTAGSKPQQKVVRFKDCCGGWGV